MNTAPAPFTRLAGQFGSFTSRLVPVLDVMNMDKLQEKIKAEEAKSTSSLSLPPPLPALTTSTSTNPSSSSFSGADSSYPATKTPSLPSTSSTSVPIVPSSSMDARRLSTAAVSSASTTWSSTTSNQNHPFSLSSSETSTNTFAPFETNMFGEAIPRNSNRPPPYPSSRPVAAAGQATNNNNNNNNNNNSAISTTSVTSDAVGDAERAFIADLLAAGIQDPSLVAATATRGTSSSSSGSSNGTTTSSTSGNLTSSQLFASSYASAAAVASNTNNNNNNHYYGNFTNTSTSFARTTTTANSGSYYNNQNGNGTGTDGEEVLARLVPPPLAQAASTGAAMFNDAMKLVAGAAATAVDRIGAATQSVPRPGGGGAGGGGVGGGARSNSSVYGYTARTPGGGSSSSSRQSQEGDPRFPASSSSSSSSSSSLFGGGAALTFSTQQQQQPPINAASAAASSGNGRTMLNPALLSSSSSSSAVNNYNNNNNNNNSAAAAAAAAAIQVWSTLCGGSGDGSNSGEQTSPVISVFLSSPLGTFCCTRIVQPVHGTCTDTLLPVLDLVALPFTLVVRIACQLVALFFKCFGCSRIGVHLRSFGVSVTPRRLVVLSAVVLLVYVSSLVWEIMRGGMNTDDDGSSNMPSVLLGGDGKQMAEVNSVAAETTKTTKEEEQ